MDSLRLSILTAFLCLPFLGHSLARTHAQAQAQADPFPLRRIIVPLDRVPAEARRQGVLVQMPRAEFEAKLREAAQAKDAVQSPPRLLKAVYAAEFSGQALVGGSGQWSVRHTGVGVLPLPQFNLAVRKLKIGNDDGVLGELDGRNLGLWIGRPGDHAVYFDWTARGQIQVGGVAFELRVPACPMTILELRLPSDHSVTIAKSAVLLSGPFDTEKAGQKLWRIQATGHTQIGFVIRKRLPAPGSALFATQVSRQVLTSASVQVEFDVQVEAPQGPVSELVFDHDVELHPSEVTLRQAEIKDWHTSPGPADGKGKKASLTVHLREPKHGVFHARIRCVAIRPPDASWISPALRLRQAVPRGETLKIVVPMERPIDHWDGGQFLLVSTSVEKDGSQTLRLVDRDPEAAAPRRPTLTLTPVAAELVVRQQSQWTIKPEGMTLSSELTYSLRRGRQFRLAIEAPPAPWRVDQVDFQPKEAMRTWTTVGTKILIDLQTALEPRVPGKVTIHMKRPAERTTLGQHLTPIPELIPATAAWREATLAIHVDPSMQASLVSASAPATLPTPAADDQEWPPSYFFKYNNQAIAGVLRLQTMRAAHKTRIRQTVSLSPQQSHIDNRIDIDPVTGLLTHLDLTFSVPLRGAWTVVSEADAPPARWEPHFEPASAARLLLLGSRRGVDRLAACAWLARGETRRLRWDRPLTRRTSIVVSGPLVAAAETQGLPLFGVWPGPKTIPFLRTERPRQRWEIPVITVGQADDGLGEIVVNATDVVLQRSEPIGMQPVGAGDGAASRTFHWRQTSPAPALMLWTSRDVATDDGPALFDHGHLTSCFQQQGESLHHFRFQAVRWPKVELPVRLPSSAGRVLGGRLDGLWLDNLQQHANEDGIELRMPMPLDGKSHWFDIVFASETTPWLGPFGFTAHAPQPQLPGTPVRQRQTWRLAPGLAPLHRERLTMLDLGGDSPAARLRRLWQSADALTPSAADDWLEPQRQVLLGADAATRRKGAPGTLGETIERLIVDGLKEQSPLLLDRAALRQAELGPASSVQPGAAGAGPQASWEAFGLLYVPNPVAPLLTTKRRWLDWRLGREMPNGLHDALTKAIAHGQDSLGEFCRADDWLRTETPARDERAVGQWVSAHGSFQGWTEWAIIGADEELTSALVVVNQIAVRIIGLAGAFLLGLGLLAARRRISWAIRLRLTILLLACDLMSFIALPPALADLAFWPGVALAGLVVIDYVVGASRPATQSSANRLGRRTSAAVGCVVATMLSCDWLVRAQPDLVETVYFAEVGGKQELAFVRPELLKRLEQLRRRATQPTQAAVLVSAHYHGKAQDAVSVIQAQFELYSFSDTAVLHVPLAGVELHDGAFVDGAPAFPTAANGKPGYVVAIQGKGWHRLTLRFAVRHQALGDFREARWTIPMLPQSQLIWQAPASLGHVQASHAAGEVTTTRAADGKSQEIRASLGRDPQVQLRWQATVVSNPSDPKVREYYFWRFETSAPSLAAVLEYSPAGGNLSRVELELPDSMEVCDAKVNGGGSDSSAGNWQVLKSSGTRRLAVQLPAPTSAPFRVHVTLALRGALIQANRSLRLPTPVGAIPMEGVLAYWIDYHETTDTAKNLGVTSLAPEAFAAAWSKLGMSEAGPPTRAYSFRRAAANASLEVTLPAVQPHVQLEADWVIQPGDAALRLQATWSNAREVSYVELTAPKNLRIIELLGPNLHHWTFHQQKLRAWLEKPSQQVALTLHASLPSTADAGRFEIAKVQVLLAQLAPALVNVASAPGWDLSPLRLQNLQAEPGGRKGRYRAVKQDYEGVFALRPAATPPEFHAITSVEQRGDAAYVTVSLVGWLVRGDFPTLTLRLKRWTGETPRLEFSAPVAHHKHDQVGDDHVWTLQFAAGSPLVSIIKIHGAAAIGKKVALPHIELKGGKLMDELASWPTTGWSIMNMRGLKEIPAGAAQRWPLLAALPSRRSMSLWIADQPQWHCELAAPKLESPRSIQVLFAEQQAQDAGRGRWLHQADWLLQTKEARELSVTLPPDAQPVLAQVNGWLVDARALAPATWAVPLPAQSGLFHVRLAWRYGAGLEEFGRPRLASPTLPVAEAGIVYGVVHVPAGTYLPAAPAGFADAEPARLAALAEAAALAEKYASAQESPDDRIGASAAWRQLFERTARQLDYLAALHADQETTNAAAKLRQKHPASVKRAGSATARPREMSGSVWNVARSDEGRPLYWVERPGDLFLDAASSQAHVASWFPEAVVLGAMAMMLLSWLPGGTLWLARLWPEQLAGLTVLAWAVWGGSVMAGLLIAVAASARLLSLAAALRLNMASLPHSTVSSQSR